MNVTITCTTQTFWEGDHITYSVHMDVRGVEGVASALYRTDGYPSPIALFDAQLNILHTDAPDGLTAIVEQAAHDAIEARCGAVLP